MTPTAVPRCGNSVIVIVRASPSDRNTSPRSSADPRPRPPAPARRSRALGRIVDLRHVVGRDRHLVRIRAAVTGLELETVRTDRVRAVLDRHKRRHADHLRRAPLRRLADRDRREHRRPHRSKSRSPTKRGESPTSTSSTGTAGPSTGAGRRRPAHCRTKAPELPMPRDRASSAPIGRPGQSQRAGWSEPALDSRWRIHYRDHGDTTALSRWVSRTRRRRLSAERRTVRVGRRGRGVRARVAAFR